MNSYKERFSKFLINLKKVLLDLNVFSDNFSDYKDFENLENEIKALIFSYFHLKLELVACREWFKMEKLELKNLTFEAHSTELTYCILADIRKLKDKKG